MWYWASFFVIRAVLLSGLEVTSLSNNIWTFQVPRVSHLSFMVFFVISVLVQPLVGWSASCSKLARCGRAGSVWVTFSHPFPHVRVGSAVLKRATQSSWMLPNASSALSKETSDHWPKGCLHACLWLQLPGITFTCHFTMLLLLQVLGEEEKCRLTGYTDKTCARNFLKWGRHYTGTILLSWTQKSGSHGMTSYHNCRLHWLQWMTRSSLVLWHALCTPQCIVELPFWPLNLTADFLHPICWKSLHMLGWIEPIWLRV